MKNIRSRDYFAAKVRKNKMDCLFCEIIAGNIPSNKLYEDDRVLAFYDINPQAPVHFLVIPKAHIASADAITADNAETVAYIFSLIPALAAKAGLTGGYRVITNCGPDACQSVPHLHFHVLGGAQLADRMA
jgi:histidine triad (HIT) family protein